MRFRVLLAPLVLLGLLPIASPAYAGHAHVWVQVTFTLLQAFDLDDEEDLDVTVTANGVPAYGATNVNHDVGVGYAGPLVYLGCPDTLTVTGTVQSTDYHQPSYGTASKVTTPPTAGIFKGTGPLPLPTAPQVPGNGYWQVDYTVTLVAPCHQ